MIFYIYYYINNNQKFSFIFKYEIFDGILKILTDYMKDKILYPFS
jgi:hypothetical protein